MPILIVLLMSLLLTSCAHIRDNTTAVNGAIADTATTVIGIKKYSMVETNPIGFPATILLKATAVIYIKTNPNDLTDQELKELDHLSGSLWLGAAANNIAIIVGASNPLGLFLGLTTGIALYLNKE